MLNALRRILSDPEKIPPTSAPHGASFHERPLMMLSHSDPFTMSNAFEGVHIFGGNGSGKSSGSGRALADAYLRAGMGGLILTAKPDEAAMWMRYAERAGRREHVIRFCPEESKYFNFLTYEQKRPGRGRGMTENLVKLLTTLSEATQQGKSEGGKNEKFFKMAMEQMLRNTIDLALLARPGENLTLPLMRDIIASAPKSADQIDSEAWLNSSLCNRLMNEALARESSMSDEEKRDFETTGQYWFNEFPNLAPETRSSVVATFTVMADGFMRGTIGTLFSSGLTVLPEMTQAGALWIVDLPVKNFGHLGRAAQILIKYMWQQAMERRDVAKNPNPVFLWADEAHNFVNEHDVNFQTTARSARACTVYLSQTLPNYYWALGGEDKGMSLTDSLMATLQTKIFHANSDTKTNKWAADLIGKRWQSRFNSNSSTGGERAFAGGQQSAGFSESLEYAIQPDEFGTLRKGGPANGLLVDSIIHQGGRRWIASNGETYLKTTFRQEN